MTQEEFASRIDRTQTELSRYENLRRVNFEILPVIHTQFKTLFTDDTMDDIEPMDLLKPWDEIVARRTLKRAV